MRSSTWCCVASSVDPPRLDLNVYPYLPRAQVTTTSAASYMSLLGGAAP